MAVAQTTDRDEPVAQECCPPLIAGTLHPLDGLFSESQHGWRHYNGWPTIGSSAPFAFRSAQVLQLPTQASIVGKPLLIDPDGIKAPSLIITADNASTRWHTASGASEGLALSRGLQLLLKAVQPVLELLSLPLVLEAVQPVLELQLLPLVLEAVQPVLELQLLPLVLEAVQPVLELLSLPLVLEAVQPVLELPGLYLVVPSVVVLLLLAKEPPVAGQGSLQLPSTLQHSCSPPTTPESPPRVLLQVETQIGLSSPFLTP